MLQIDFLCTMVYLGKSLKPYLQDQYFMICLSSFCCKGAGYMFLVCFTDDEKSVRPRPSLRFDSMTLRVISTAIITFTFD